MKSRTTRWKNSFSLGWAFTLLFAFSPARPVAAQAPPGDDQQLAERHADRLLLMQNENVARKWPAAPRISCIGDAVKYRTIVQQFTADVGVILAGLPTPALGPDDSSDADILFAVGTSAQLAAVRRAQHVAPGNYESYYRYAADKSIQRFWIFIETSRLAGERDGGKLEIYRCLLTAIGFSHGLQREKVNYEPSLRTQFDRKLLRFLYEFVPSGASRTDVSRAVRKQWPLLQVAPLPAP